MNDERWTSRRRKLRPKDTGWAESNVFVFRRFYVALQLVRRLEQLNLEADVAISPYHRRHAYPKSLDFKSIG